MPKWPRFVFREQGTDKSTPGAANFGAGFDLADDAADNEVNIVLDLSEYTGADLPIGGGGTGQSTQAAAFDALAPTTTRGDLIYMGASDNERLPKGNEGLYLKAGTNDPAWSSVVDIQEFTAGGTWTKPAGALWVDVIMFGAGGGGGAGRIGNAGSNRNGGGGGTGAAAVFVRYLASDLTGTVAITIGTGGAGGTTTGTTAQDGGNGSAGGLTMFGGYFTIAGGGGGGGGTATNDGANAGATGDPGGHWQGLLSQTGNGAAAGYYSTAPSPGALEYWFGGGGGGGGGIDSANVARAGSDGGGVYSPVNQSSGAGTGRAAGTSTTGGTGTAPYKTFPSGGGGGGGGRTGGVGPGQGGTAGYGGGGGGSGAGVTAVAGKNGGAGGGGYCLVVSWR